MPKGFGINKRVRLVWETTVRTRLTMSFPDPLNPHTYFYKAVLAGCAHGCGGAHTSNLYFSKLWHESVSNPPPPLLLPDLSQIKSSVERKHELASALHPSPSIFSCGLPPPPPPPRISSPDSFRDTHVAERLPGSRAPPPGQSGYCSLLMRFHAPVRHNDFREMLHAALTQLDGPIPKELGALYCEEASHRR